MHTLGIYTEAQYIQQNNDTFPGVKQMYRNIQLVLHDPCSGSITNLYSGGTGCYLHMVLPMVADRFRSNVEITQAKPNYCHSTGLIKFVSHIDMAFVHPRGCYTLLYTYNTEHYK